MEWLCFNGLLAAINGERQLCITLKPVLAIFSVLIKNCHANLFQIGFNSLTNSYCFFLFVFPHSFSLFSAEDCVADEPDNFIVPIAVGVALAVLIIIVLLAYLIGRKRSQMAGYEQFDS